MQKKVLLIDDESSLRRTLAMGLGQRGYDTEPCENGLLALKRLDTLIKNRIPLNAIVIDIQLPDIKGTKLAKIIKFKYPNIPIILITGYMDRINQQEIKDLNIQALIEKPFTPEELSDELEKSVLSLPEIEQMAQEEEVKTTNHSTYLLIHLKQDANFYQIYQELYYLEPVVYCDATKGDYDIIMLIQAKDQKECEDFCEQKIKPIPGISEIEYLNIQPPVLDDSIRHILQTADNLFANDLNNTNSKRDFSRRVNSYIIMEVEKEKIEQVYPQLKFHDQVVFCDHCLGKFNIILFVTGNYFSDIDRLIEDYFSRMEGVLKIIEFPVINVFEM